MPSRSRSLRFLLVLLALLAVLPPARARAQVGGSSDIIVGTVTGPDGRPIEGARVEVTSIETEITRSKSTNAEGRYTILFPDGGGQYRVTVRFIGMAPRVITLARLADEDRLVADVTLSPTATTLSTVVVQAERTPPRNPDRPTPGSTERTFSGDQLARLPVDASDPNAVAQLAPGVVGVDGSDTVAAGVSVAGQRPDQNQVTLDGLTFGAETVPQEAVRSTRVVTNTYDVARGQFTGGQIATTTRGGTNAVAGTLTYGLREPSLQWEDEGDADGDGPRGLTSTYTQHQLSGGLGGPFVRDRLFWFGAVQLRRRFNPLQSLLDLSASDLAAYGADPDSAQRFVDLVRGYGLPLRPAGVPDDRTNSSASVIARFDQQLTDDHSLMLRLNWNGTWQEGVRIGSLDVPQLGGEQSSDGGGAMVTLSSVLGTFLNEFRGYAARTTRESDPYLLAPEGRVHLASSTGESRVGIANLEFGGNASLPNASGERQLELSDELSWLTGSHRFKIGALLNAGTFDRTSGSNRNGTFVYNSLDDLEAGTPVSFTRSLSPGDRSGSTYTGALYAGDTWRRGRGLQLTYGVRVEGSRYGDRPAFNPDVFARFGRRTDRFPSDVRVSPRAGFSWIIGAGDPGQTGGPGSGPQRGRRAAGGPGAGAGSPAGALVVRGGLGEFRGRAPTGLFSSAIDATGLPSGETQLVCIGDAVPTPNWAGYLADPSSIPTTCADGGGPTAPSDALPNVTVFDPDFDAPRSWRASLGATRRLAERLTASVDASYALGRSLYGVRDLNLDTIPRFTLADEGGRPVYVPSSSIVAGTGAAPLAPSRRDAEYAYVFDVHSGLESRTTQLTLSMGGAARRSLLWNASYTWSRSRDQASSSSGRGGSALGLFDDPTTAGNPNMPEWAPSDFERRHAVVGSSTWMARPWLDITSVLRFTSGSPYTPRVSGDINGDGVRNDRAFVFGEGATDTAVANGMARLLAAAPDEARRCLERQRDRVASRNSCRTGWSTTLDLQANLRPYLGSALQRRLQFLVTLVNPLAGIDRLLHGDDGLRGWGQPRSADPVLLQLRGFEPATQRYRYAVNERFGSDLALRARSGRPFEVGIQARLQIGPDRQRERLQAFVRGTPAGGAAPDGPGGGFTLQAMLERVAPDPTAPIIRLRDTLGLSDTQVILLMAVADSMRARNDSVFAAVRAQVEREMQAGATLQTIFPRVQPRLQEARDNYVAAVAEARKILTAAQWERLPEEIRNPSLRAGRGRAGARRGGDGTPPE